LSTAAVTLLDVSTQIRWAKQHDILHDLFVPCRCPMPAKVLIAIGAKDIENPLKKHMEKIKIIHSRDLADGYGEVYLPYALEHKYPNAGREWGWQYVFPSKNRSLDPR